MNIAPKTPIPCELHTYSLFFPEQLIARMSLDVYRDKISSYGPGHPYVPSREETKVVSIAVSRPEANTYLNGVYSMMYLLKQKGDAPLNKVQKALIFSAFPNSAKKVLSAFETPGAFLTWLHEKPEEVFSAMEMELPPINDTIKRNRAFNYGMNEAESREYCASGKIPERFNPSATVKAEPAAEPVKRGKKVNTAESILEASEVARAMRMQEYVSASTIISPSWVTNAIDPSST